MTIQENVARAEKVILRRFGQFLQVWPPCEELLDKLRTGLHVPRKDGQEGLAIGRVGDDLYRLTTDLDKPVLECFLGLEAVIREVLSRAGYQVEVRFKVSEPLPCPDVNAVERMGVCDLGFLDLVRQKERALIRYEPGEVDVAWLIAEVALAWPSLTVAVAVTRVDEARMLRNRLLRYLPAVVAVSSRNQASDEEVGRVVVATYNGLGHTGIEIEKRDIVIALNAVEASNPEALSRLGHASQARIYGLLLDSPLARRDEDLLRLLFGFEEMTIPGHGSQEARVDVVWCCSGGMSGSLETQSVLEVKRRGIWHNQVRNRRLAQLARMMAKLDCSGLQRSFPTVLSGLQGLTSPRVAVLVENVEHGLQMARRLPGWPLFTGKEVCSTGLPGNSLKSLRQGDQQNWECCPGAIVTFSGVNSFPLGTVNVLIRCDGGTELFMPKRICSAVHVNGTVTRALLVDFDDRFHPTLRRWSRQRRKAYLERGWYSPGVDRLQARVEQFLSSRPAEAV